MSRDRDRTEAEKHVVIIGAGPGGLASAMLLARSGVRVTVVERHARIGGRTATFEQDGYKFDIGPTFFLYPRVLKEIFADCGYDLERELPMQRLDPQYRLIFGAGGQIDATPDVERMKQQIAGISPRDAQEFTNFLEQNRQKLAAFLPVLESPFEGWGDLLRPKMLRLLPLIKPWLSLDEDLRMHFRDDRVRLGFSFQSKYLGMSPFQCPSLFSILSFLEYEHGVFHPIGGCGAVTQTMARLCEDMGVEIRLEDPAEEILVERAGPTDRAVGIRTRTGTLKADAVVINADFAEAARRLIPSKYRRKWNNEKIAQKQFSCSTFMMYLGIEGQYNDLAHHTIYLTEDYRQNLRDIEETHCLSNEPSFYVQNASVTDPTVAPEGHSTLYVLVPVTHESPQVDWTKEKRRFRDLAFAQMKKIGLHDVQSRIRTEKTVTPGDWAADFGLFKGATFSMKHSLDQMLHLRPHNRFEDIRSIYLTGGGTHPGSGLPVIFQSARISTKLLMDDLGIAPQWTADATGACTEQRKIMQVVS